MPAEPAGSQRLLSDIWKLPVAPPICLDEFVTRTGVVEAGTQTEDVIIVPVSSKAREKKAQAKVTARSTIGGIVLSKAAPAVVSVPQREDLDFPVPKPQIRRRMVVKRTMSEDLGDAGPAHRQHDGSFQQASLSRFVGGSNQNPAPNPLRRAPSTPVLLPTPRLRSINPLGAGVGAVQRSNCSTAATVEVPTLSIRVFGDDYNTPIPVRRRTINAMDTLRPATVTPEVPRDSCTSQMHRWSTPICPEGADIQGIIPVSCEGTLPSLIGPRRKKEMSAPSSQGTNPNIRKEGEANPPPGIRKRARTNSCASELEALRQNKRTRTHSLM